MKTDQLFFTYVEMTYSAQNAYQKEIIARIQSYSRLLVESPENYLKEIRFLVHSLHKSFPRCKVMGVNDWQGMSGDQHIKIESTHGILVSISIRKVDMFHYQVSTQSPELFTQSQTVDGNV